jgi:hypothetical protein
VTTDTKRSVPDESRHVSRPGTRTLRRAPTRALLSVDGANEAVAVRLTLDPLWNEIALTCISMWGPVSLLSVH